MQEIKDLILRRRLQMLIHSCIYYELNRNIITDKKFDEWAKDLVRLQKEFPEISKEVEWYEAFADWDGSTGAFLPLKNEWVMNKANQVLFLYGNAKIKNTSEITVNQPKVEEKKVRKLF